MSTLPIYTALNVPTVISYPSANCLQWSGDGQACFVSKSAVYILTPDPGINFDTTSVLKAPVGKENANDKPLGWFRTMIECNRERPLEKPQNWPDISQDRKEWGATSLGSLDLSVRNAVCSPSNLTTDGRCVLATMNSNMEVSLWTATKNHLKGEWIKIQDVTAFLSKHFLLLEKKPSLATIFQVQVTSIAWSTQPNFGIAPTPIIDGSILATGNRAGCVILLRYQSDACPAEHVLHLETIKLSEKWVTHLTWSPWMFIETGTSKAYLAYGTSDGGVGLVVVTLTLRPIPNESAFGEDYNVELLHEPHSHRPSDSDGRSITALSWIEVSTQNLILVHCKPGVVHLWSAFPLAKNAPLPWSDSREIHLQTQRVSVGSSSLYPVSGMMYIPSSDALILCLFDGSFHAIHRLASDPSYLPQDPSSSLTGEKLSATSRSIFSQAEMRDIRSSDVNRTSGMMSYDGFSTVVWAHEACRPTDFSYKHEAKHNSMLVVAQLWDDISEHAIANDLSEILMGAKSVLGNAPIHLLRPIFLHLSKSGRFHQLRGAILQVLRQPYIDDSVNVIVTPWSAGGLTPELKSDFRRSLARQLFGWDNLLNLRMRLSVADLCWKLSSTESQAQVECGQVAQYLLTTIAHWVLRTIVRHLSAIMSVITPTDVPFVLRIVVQGLLPGLPADLSAEAQHLSETLNAVLHEIDQTATGLIELCPACHVEVPLVDITNALCANGHAWSRCSVTSFILATPMVRTCIGCSRKAFLPLSQNLSASPNWLPTAAQSWIVEELLEAVHRCLFCGNSFVSIL